MNVSIGNNDYWRKNKKTDEELKNKFKKTFNFNNDINKFILLLRKGVYLYGYMDEWEKIYEIKWHEKEEFYSNLNIEDITDADYMHAKKVSKDFEIKNVGECHYLCLKSDTLLLTDVFKNFRKICLKIYHLDLVKFLSGPGVAWQAALKKRKVKLELLTNNDKLLMVEIVIRRGECSSIHRYAKANNKYSKDYGKNKESWYLKYWDANHVAKASSK